MSGLPLSLDPAEDWTAAVSRWRSETEYTLRNSYLTASELCLQATWHWTVSKLKSIPAALAAEPCDYSFLISAAKTIKPTWWDRFDRFGRGRKPVLFARRPKVSLTDDQYTFACFVGKLVATTRRSAKRRAGNFPKDHSGDPSDLTPQDVFDKLTEQKGRCAYSNLPLVFHLSSDWQCSIERLDNSQSYTVPNTVLICYEFNTFKKWSKAKWAFFYQCLAEKYSFEPPSVPSNTDAVPSAEQ